MRPAVDGVAGSALDRGGMRGPLPYLSGLAHSAATGLELPASGRTGSGAGRSQDPAVEAGAPAGVKKKAETEGRTIVFIDESGLSERPHRCRTWAPKGKTPVLQYHFNWKVLSAIAGITWWNFYFRLYRKTIRAPQVVDFLAHLLRHLPGRLLVIWDRSKTHRSHLVGEFVAGRQGRLALDYLPAYAPELNPVEYIWGYWKH